MDLAARSVYRVVRTKVHQGADPLFTSEERKRLGLDGDYGGVLGTISPTSFVRVMDLLKPTMGLDSVFCDVGCGPGIASLVVASHFTIQKSMGFDVSSTQVQTAKRAREVVGFTKTPTTFLKDDVFQLGTLEPCTHAYAFSGYKDFLVRVAHLAANTSTLEWLAVVYLRKSDLKETGLWADGQQAYKLTDVKMAGGRSYLGAVLKMTPARRASVLEKLGAVAETKRLSEREEEEEPQQVKRARRCVL